MLVRHRKSSGRRSRLLASTHKALHEALPSGEEQAVAVLRANGRRVTAAFGTKLLLKVYRKLEAATNPDLEIGRVLTARGFAHTPRHAGDRPALRRPGQEPMTFAVVRDFAVHEETAWQYTLDSLGQYFERAGPRRQDADPGCPAPT